MHCPTGLVSVTEYVGKGRIKMEFVIWSFILALKRVLPFLNSNFEIAFVRIISFCFKIYYQTFRYMVSAERERWEREVAQAHVFVIDSYVELHLPPLCGFQRLNSDCQVYAVSAFTLCTI